jgi:hypothetical protein
MMGDTSKDCSFWTRKHELVIHHWNSDGGWSWNLYTRDVPRKSVIGGTAASWSHALNMAVEHGGFNMNESSSERPSRWWLLSWIVEKFR